MKNRKSLVVTLIALLFALPSFAASLNQIFNTSPSPITNNNDGVSQLIKVKGSLAENDVLVYDGLGNVVSAGVSPTNLVVSSNSYTKAESDALIATKTDSVSNALSVVIGFKQNANTANANNATLAQGDLADSSIQPSDLLYTAQLDGLQQLLTSSVGTNAIATYGKNAEIISVNCLDFDGTNSYVKMPFTTDVGASDFSFHCTINPDIVSGAAKTIFSHGEVSSNSRSCWVVLANGLLSTRLSADGTAQTEVIGGTAVPTNTWTSLSAYKTGSSIFYYYNGSLNLAGTTVSSLRNSGGYAYTGSRYSGTAMDYPFNGKISDVHLDILPTTLDVYLYIGQSNCEGNPGEYGTLPTILQGENFPFFEASINHGTQTKRGTFLKPFNSTQWGAELVFGQVITQRAQKRIAIVKVSTGGTSLAVDWQPGGEQYTQLTNAWANFETDMASAGYTIGDVRGIWMQGEKDAQSNLWANAYVENYDNMNASFENDTGVELVNTTFCRINDEGNPGSDRVRAALVELGNRPGNTWIDTDSMPRRPDGVHLDPDGLQALGTAIGNAVVVNAANNADPVFWNVYSEGSSTNIYDVSGNTNTGTAVSASWTTSSGIESWNHLKGWSMRGATDAYIPALYNLSGDASGGALQHLGGFVHNGSECDLILWDGSTNTYVNLLESSSYASNSDPTNRYSSVGTGGRITTFAAYTNNLPVASDTRLKGFLELQK